MKEKKVKKVQKTEQKRYDRGQVFVKITAGILAVLMVLAVAASVIYAIFL